ncbi:MAG: rplX [Dehalococcoidia bacterium]|nr:rplX [Dehalococcoidia bacterium]MBF8303642.1 rplX [Dehalococcoidia bacterium]
MKIHKNDSVLVIRGKDKGKKGKVLHAFPKENRVIVEKVNMIKRHARARGPVRQAGIVEREAPINVAKVMILCGKCSHPVRIGYRSLEDGKRVRFCHACTEVID